MDENAITILDEARCAELLPTVSVGRLVTVTGGRAEIFPVNYAWSDGKVYFRTAEGTKLAGITVQPDVLFQVDHIDEGESAWSIVLRGSARRLDSFTEINRAEELDLKPWVPTLKYTFVEITADEVSGRGFVFGEEPERYIG